MRRVVSVILRLFPKEFRRRFAPDMLATFEDRWREQGGYGLAMRTVLDILTAAVMEHFSKRPAPIRQTQGDGPMTVLLQDLRFAARTLLRSPGFSIVTLLTLALGIGLNTAMFSVAYGVLWRSLPYPHPDRLAMVGEVNSKAPDEYWGVSYPNLVDWRARSTSFEHLAGVMEDERVLREGRDPVRVTGAAVTHDFFDVMGVAPALGRVFGEVENRKGAAPVVVLSHHMWINRFAADPGILGRVIRFDSSVATVIGVMPSGFEYQQAEFWTPIEQVIEPYFRNGRTVWVLSALGRLRDGKTLSAAQAEVEAIAQQIRHDFPDTNRGLVVRASPVKAELSRDLRPALLVLLGAVTLVLLIACGNIAALMLVRGTGRVREMAIRTALGGRGGRLVRQLLTECGLLAVFGGSAGVALSYWATRSISLLTKDPRLLEVHTDTSVLLFAAASTLVTIVLFGIAPAIRATRVDVGTALKSGTRTSGFRERALTQRVLVVAEVALCLALLCGAGLLLRSFRRVLDVSPGFRTENLVIMRVNLPGTYKTVAAVTQFYKRASEGLAALPGVTGATIVNRLPITGGEATGDINIEGRPSASGELGGATFRRIMPNYFELMGIPLVRGRIFDERDLTSDLRPVIIDEGFARRFWAEGDAIGHRIKVGPRNGPDWLTIIGIVGNVHQRGLDSNAPYSTYEPIVRRPSLQFEIAVRAAGDTGGVISAARARLRTMEPQLLIENAGTMAERIGQSVAPRRLNLVLFGVFAALALGLASIGLYGVVAYAAGQRTREFGIRMAVGAKSSDVLRLVLGQGFRLALIGVAVGFMVTLSMGRVLTRLLFGVQPSDPGTLIAAALVLTTVALTASWLPARRACRIAPVDALRSE